MKLAKFIVAHGQVFFSEAYTPGAHDPRHRDIAVRNGINFSEIRGGGLALPDSKWLFENSYEFGPYNKEEVQKILPDWNVDEPRPGEPHPGD